MPKKVSLIDVLNIKKLKNSTKNIALIIKNLDIEYTQLLFNKNVIIEVILTLGLMITLLLKHCRL